MEGTIITKKGTALIAKLLASGEELAFTRAAVGTGSIPSGYDPAGMNDLNAYRMDGKISGCSTDGDEATVVFQVSSVDVEEGFTITEAGLFARDPDEGEILYAYLDLSGDPQYVYARGSTVQKFAEIEFTTVVGRLERVTVVMSPRALITREEFEERAEEIYEELQAVREPEFDDSGTVAGISNFTDFRDKIKSKMDIFGFFRDFKAGMKFVLHQGQIVNNLMATDPNTVLSGPMGKELKGYIDKLNGDLSNTLKTSGTSNSQMTTSETYASMSDRTMKFFACNGDSVLGSEFGYSQAYEGLGFLLIKHSEWRGFGLAGSLFKDLFFGRLTSANTLAWHRVVLQSDFDAIYTQDDNIDIAGAWRLIKSEEKRKFSILNIHGGAKIFGQQGNYLGEIFINKGYITGIMVDHWTGNLYTVKGATYVENELQFIPISK